MATFKDASEVARNITDTLKSVVIIAVVALIIFGADKVDWLLNRYNVSKIEFGGVTMDRQKAIQSLATNADELAKAQTALKQASGELAALKQSYVQSVSALEQTKVALTQAESRLAAAGQSVVSGGAIDQAQLATTQVLARSRMTVAAATAATANVEEAAQSTRQAVQSLPRSAVNAGYAVVFGADTNLGQARDQLAAVKRAGLPEGQIFQRQRMYRSVLTYPTQAAAAEALPHVRIVNRYARDAYVVNLSNWCPNPTPRGGYLDCGF